MLSDDIKKIYFEREDQNSNSNPKDSLNYRFFAQEDDEVELEITSNSD